MKNKDIYYDCSPQSSNFADRNISSYWTPYGIRCIDSEFCRRIQNIYKPVIKLIKVDRKAHYFDGNYRSDWWDDYTDLPLDKDFYSYDRVCFVHDEGGLFKELEDVRTDKGKANGIKYQQFELLLPTYTYTHPTYSAKHKGEDPKALAKEIRNHSSLHKDIKNNLLGNLKNYINKY